MNIPCKCPSCEGRLLITELSCPDCKTDITGSFDLPLFASLSREDEAFLRAFLVSRGSIKEVERRLNISYPTVKSRLEGLLSRLGFGGAEAAARQSRLEILARLERGEISAKEAVELIKNGDSKEEI